MDLHIPDLSKWQASVDFSKVGPAVILRVHSGRGVDSTFAERLPLARRYQKVRGFYLYLVADRDAVTQATEAAKAIGRLQPGEFCVVDIEVGSGDQKARAEAACATFDRLCGGRAWVYSGLSFYSTHLAGLNRPLWIAAYRADEPTSPKHVLWQHSDAEPHPGVGACDCSIFHGTVDQLRALVTPSEAPTDAPWWFRRGLTYTKGKPLMVGSDVTELQKWLVTHGFLKHYDSLGRSSISGRYDAGTATAVDHFRTAHGMTHSTTFDLDAARHLQAS